MGKSSLFNALLGGERAIVTEIAGTTRDQIHERFTINSIPISLIDTAGLRETTDTVESIGVERSKAAMSDADIVIVMLDASQEIVDEDKQILKSIDGIDHLIAINKIDKVGTERISNLKSQISNSESRFVEISAKTGDGLDDLQKAIIGPFATTEASAAGFLVTDARHHDLLLRSERELRNSITQFNQKMSEEIVLIGLHNSLRYLGQITGETTTEDMLTIIFATFCIGK